MINWVNMTQLAKMCGVCPNTFKKNLLPIILQKYPPKPSGTRKSWSQTVANEIVDKVETGELFADLQVA